MSRVVSDPTAARANDPASPTSADWYAVLGLEPHASPTEINVAYQRQRTLYDPTHGATMNDDFADLAATKRAEIEAAYAVLSDPQRRFAYDQSRGLVGNEAQDRRGVSNREVLWTIGGILVGLLLLSLVYNLTADKSTQGQAQGRFTAVNHVAAPIDLRTLDGGRFNLVDYRGKVVLVNFWATWCVPCREETPALQAAYAKLRDEGLVIVGLNLLDNELAQSRTEADVRAFTEQYGVTYPIALDETGSVAQAYQIYPIPVSYIVDPNGNVRYIRIGQITTNDVEQIFRLVKSS